MIVDSSALLAVLFREPEERKFAEAISRAKIVRMAAPTLLEACMASTRLNGTSSIAEIRALVQVCNIEIIAFDANAAQLAIEAFEVYGKGQGHPAQLNFGDCMSYAVSKIEAMPLLFKGDDFRLTDVECAI